MLIVENLENVHFHVTDKSNKSFITTVRLQDVP